MTTRRKPAALLFLLGGVLMTALLATRAMALDHGPVWSGSNVEYGLPSPFVNEIAPGGYAHCRRGVWVDSTGVSLLGSQILNFNRFVVGPSSWTVDSTVNTFMDTPGPGRLFMIEEKDSVLSRMKFGPYSGRDSNNREAWNWVRGGPADADGKLPSNGQVEVDSEWDWAYRNLSLYRYYNMTDANLPGLTNTVKRYVILIHGWNCDAVTDGYAGAPWSALKTNIQNFFDWTGSKGAQWKVLPYRMEADTATGGLDPLSTGNSAEAAEAARLHGYHLAQLILEKCPGVEYVHLIAHSAGTWAARSGFQYLTSANSPAGLRVQMTILDGFIPEQSGVSGDTNLGIPEMNAVIQAPCQTNKIFGMDNYYSWDSSVPGTQELFNWGSHELVDDVDTGVYWVGAWSGHDGPVNYYADSVARRFGRPGGWTLSMAYRDVMGNVGLPGGGGTTNGPFWVGGSEVRYGLPGEGLPGQFVNEIAPGGYAHCRRGVWVDSTNPSLLGSQILNFNGFVVGPAVWPSQWTEPVLNGFMDNPHPGGLFLVEDSPLSRIGFGPYSGRDLNNREAWNWQKAGVPNARTELPSDGQVEVDSEWAGAYRDLSLYRYYNMTDANLPGITNATTRYVILIHGWNPGAQTDIYYDPDKPGLGSWDAMEANLTRFFSTNHVTSWKVLKYHMESDTATGGLDPLSTGNSAEAAEGARLHGYHMAQMILAKCPNIEYVHLIAHSAGTWAARSCFQYLTSANSPAHVRVQMTILDGFVPAQSTISGETNLGIPEINSVIGSPCQTNKIFGMDNYFAEQDFNVQLGEYIPDPAVGTQNSFSWGIHELVGDVGIDSYSVRRWTGHGGPIYYYADSAANPENWGGTCYAGGWPLSMAYKDTLGGGLPGTLITGGGRGTRGLVLVR